MASERLRLWETGILPGTLTALAPGCGQDGRAGGGNVPWAAPELECCSGSSLSQAPC